MTTGLDRHRFRGALLGLAVGDALGSTVEFQPPGTFDRVTDMVGGGPFDLPAGAWTDDTSMALCLAESLVKRAGFDPVDQLHRYVRWYREGHWSSVGWCFDIGNATRAALHRFERTGEPYPGDADPAAAGNAPLMRLAPVALAYVDDPLRAVRYAGLSARTTHGAPEAVDACRYLAGLLLGALRGADAGTLLQDGVFEPVPGLWSRAPLHPRIAAIAEGSYRTKEPPAVRGGGYVVDALEAALWALRSTTTFQDGVLAAVNLGDDADTTAAIYGQLAGALYGVEGIPERWRERVVLSPKIGEVADALFQLAERTRTAGPIAGSHWVQPGRLLAGPSPAAGTLDAILGAGVTCVIDLRDDGAVPPPALHLPADISDLRVPVRAEDVRTSWRIVIALSALHMAMGEGERVYVHGDDGALRTGMVVACLMVGNGAPSTEVLTQLSALHTRASPAARAAPRDALERLRSGEPVVVHGPGPGWTVQAAADREGRLVRVEVLDPAYWETGPPLPAAQQRALEELGLRREEGMWARTDAGGDGSAVDTAADLLHAVARRAWCAAPPSTP